MTTSVATQNSLSKTAVTLRAHEVCESRGGRLGLPVPNKPHGFSGRKATLNLQSLIQSRIIIMDIYHALVNALSAHMIHINLNMIVYTHVEHSPTKTIYIKLLFF